MVRNQQRLEITMKCFDKLSRECRDFINNCDKISLHDDHILRGEEEVRKMMKEVENGNFHQIPSGNGNN